ncbi:hypothetical protein VTJ49DRAFT_3608 [Mycothermus thermophilus]|uniref:Uncharacterized protein n=1 Tax=Humicola insolens TaxID=85995 RepID=A0ABR3VM85_HUMIN
MLFTTPVLNRVDDIKSCQASLAGTTQRRFTARGDFRPSKARSLSRRDIAAENAEREKKRHLEWDELLDAALFGGDMGKILFQFYTGKKFRCLLPRSASLLKLAEIGPTDHAATGASDAVYQAVMDCLLLKRDAQTPLLCPDGKVRYPMNQMPGLTRFWPTTNPATQRTTYGSEKPHALINMAVQRALWILSMCYKCLRFLQKDDRTTLSLDEELLLRIVSTAKGEKQADSLKPSDKTTGGAEHRVSVPAQD